MNISKSDHINNRCGLLYLFMRWVFYNLEIQ
jgi:hypothetical protein